MRFMLTGLSVLSLCSVAHADQPTSVLFGAKLHIGTSTLVGYVGVYANQAESLKGPDGLNNLRKLRGFGFTESIVEIAHPKKVLVSTKAQTRAINPLTVTNYESNPGPFDARTMIGPVPYVPVAAAALLSSREPVYQCIAQYNEGGSEYWISYVTSVGKQILEPICSSKKEPDEATYRRLTANKRVIHLNLPNGD